MEKQKHKKTLEKNTRKNLILPVDGRLDGIFEF